MATEDDGPGAGGCFSDDEGQLSGGVLSPTARLRRDTFGATLDFIEALCDASSSLTSISQVWGQGWGCKRGARQEEWALGPGLRRLVPVTGACSVGVSAYQSGSMEALHCTAINTHAWHTS